MGYERRVTSYKLLGYGLEFEVKVRVFTVRVRELDLESYCSLAVLSNSG